MQCLFSLILLALTFSDKVLVLKNGKTIRCDAYEIENGKVMIYRNNEQFALAESLISWGQTEQAEAAVIRSDEVERERIRAKRERKKASQASDISRLMDIYDEKQRLEQDGAASTDNRQEDKSSAKTRDNGKHSFHKANNSIIVAVYVNESGPFDFVLDPNAAMTLVSDEVANGLMLNRIGTAVDGVGGADRAVTSWLNSISLESTGVGKMMVLIQDVPGLRDLGVHGLLGQDFLNNFVVSLDAANLTITLKPHRAAVKRTDAEIARSFSARAPELDSLFRGVGILTKAYTDGVFRQDGPMMLTKQSTLAVELHQELSEFKKMLERQDNAIPGKGEAAKILKCLPQLEQALIATRQQISLLLRFYNEKDFSQRALVIDTWKKVTDNAKQFNTCREPR